MLVHVMAGCYVAAKHGFGGMVWKRIYIYIYIPFDIMNINRIEETIRTFLARVRKFKIKITRSILGRERNVHGTIVNRWKIWI